MKYPMMSEIPSQRQMVEAFGGYNHNLRISDNEFYDMKNLSSSKYPVLSVRPARGVFTTPATKVQGLISKDTLCYVDGAEFVMGEYRIDMGLSTDEADCPKSLISMGAYVIIMPDKKWINTQDISKYGDIEAEFVSADGTSVSFELCRVDGTVYDQTVVSANEPSSPKNLDMWIDTSSTPHTLKQYSESSATWVSIATTYIRISAPGIGKHFEVYDGVSISGVTVESLADLNNTMVIYDKGDDYIVVIGILDSVVSQTASITVARKMPEMDFVIESGNRLYGCRYGAASNGAVVNEIYASKLGDFKNWNCFMGISTDSYAASLGSDGQFTGAITHLGYPLFFKENYLHKIYGTMPSNFQIQTTACRGVQKGSHNSLAIVNEVLYYKSRSAVCAYDGSLPGEISSALGEEVYSDAVAGWLANKYYISMKGADGKYNLFAYDTSKGMWHKEDETQVSAFCNCRGELYYIDTKSGDIKTITGSGARESTPTEFMLETGILGTSMPDKKYISKVNLRMSMDLGASATVAIQYDSSGVWKHLFMLRAASLKSFTIPIRPVRCDHFKLRIEGKGNITIFSMTKTIEEGSDV